MNPYRPTILAPDGSTTAEAEGDNGADVLPEADVPPPDHQGFLEARALGLHSIRQKLEARRKHG